MKKYAVITMDVEDWYHTYFPETEVDRSQSLLDGLDVALDIMNQRNIKGSFFVVGEIADQISEKLTNAPHQRVPTDAERTYCKSLNGRLPIYKSNHFVR